MSNAFPIPRQGLHSARAGFSLAEVAVSLGLFAFGIMGLVGLIPVALNSHQEARVDTVLAQIQQRLAAEVVLTDGQKLQELDGFARMFDAEGRETSDTTAAIYRAKITLGNFTAPGAGQSSVSLQRATLHAIYDPAGNKIGNATASGSVLVAKAESASN